MFFAFALARSSAGNLWSTLPKWLIRITLAPLPINSLIVGRAATILLSSLIVPSLSGTLKSQRTRTFFPATSKSLTCFFILNFSLLTHICTYIIIWIKHKAKLYYKWKRYHYTILIKLAHFMLTLFFYSYFIMRLY